MLCFQDGFCSVEIDGHVVSVKQSFIYLCELTSKKLSTPTCTLVVEVFIMQMRYLPKGNVSLTVVQFD